MSSFIKLKDLEPKKVVELDQDVKAPGISDTEIYSSRLNRMQFRSAYLNYRAFLEGITSS